MLADVIVVFALIAAGALLQHSLRGSFLPGWPPKDLRHHLLGQPWLGLVVLALLISLGGWAGRAHLVGISATWATATGGPTEWEYAACHKLLPVLGKCPYGGRIEYTPEQDRPSGSSQANLRCSLHGEPE